MADAGRYGATVTVAEALQVVARVRAVAPLSYVA